MIDNVECMLYKCFSFKQGMITLSGHLSSVLAFQFTSIRFHIEQLSCLINTCGWVLSLNKNDNQMSLKVHYFSCVRIYLSDLDMPLFGFKDTGVQSCSYVRTHTENTHILFQSCQGLGGHLFFLVRISQPHNDFFQLHLQSSLFKTTLHPNFTLIWPTAA